jgi:hypothetical protein
MIRLTDVKEPVIEVEVSASDRVFIRPFQVVRDLERTQANREASYAELVDAARTALGLGQYPEIPDHQILFLIVKVKEFVEGFVHTKG